MVSQPQLSLFISSKMSELAKERQAVQNALSSFLLHGWLWETDAGARPEPIRSTYLTEVEACDIYIGLFWQGYGQYTIEEYESCPQTPETLPHLRKTCRRGETRLKIMGIPRPPAKRRESRRANGLPL